VAAECFALWSASISSSAGSSGRPLSPHVVDRCRQVLEKARQRRRVVASSRGALRSDRLRCFVETSGLRPVRMNRRPLRWASSRLEPDARTAANEDDGLSE